MRSAPATERIAPVDGLRALAVVGVVWAHTWMFAGNPRLSVGSVGGIDLDLNRAVSAIGTGVDLFFVVSGFCMYLMYAGRQREFSWETYAAFVARRWRRIAPAFYAAALASAVGIALAGAAFPAVDLLAHLAFVHILPGTGGLSAPFWSLATEWHFYLVLPLLIAGAGRWGFAPTLVVCAVACLAFRAAVYTLAPELEGVLKPQLAHRLVEFLWGIGVARLYMRSVELPRALRGARGFVAGVALAYAGRLLMTTEALAHAGALSPLCRTAAEPVLTAGYALMLWNVVASDSAFRRFFSLPALQAVGRWSYSLYLWHWWPTAWIAGHAAARFGADAAVQHAAFAAILAVLIPVAALSYRLLELPYFRARHDERLRAAGWPGKRA
jgi:peptidoglycan/LPS O-acetylase OafA/YrhL